MALASRLVEPLERLPARQEGVLSRAQARTYGLSDSAIRASLCSRRWRRVYAGVYATFTGELALPARVWTAVLYCGDGAVASHETAAALHGLKVRGETPLHVTVPAWRRVVRPQGMPATLAIVIHRSSLLDRTRHPALQPARTRVEDTVVDRIDTASTVDEAVALVADACQRRRTTPARLMATMTGRVGFRWRADVLPVVQDVAAGAHSLLALRYLRDVERRHGLPTASRHGLVQRGRRREYRDVRYGSAGVRVELDGWLGHDEVEERWRDLARDNAAVADAEPVLHYGWHDVLGRYCEVAAQVAQVLQLHGWQGEPRACGPRCPVRPGPACRSGGS